MSVRKAFIANKTMEVISEDEYIRRSKFADPMFEDTCVEKNGTLYPIQKRYNEGAPGVYDAGPCFKYTNASNKEDYSANKIIDFDNATNYADMIKLKDKLNKAEIARLTTKDNIYVPTIGDNDSPALKLIKEAVGNKNIDPESYRQRMGSDYMNLMRLVTSDSNHNISIKKMAAFGEAFDFDIEVTVTDKPNAVNPIGKSLSAKITTGE